MNAGLTAVTVDGRLFHALAAATRNARLVTRSSFVTKTMQGCILFRSTFMLKSYQKLASATTGS